MRKLYDEFDDQEVACKMFFNKHVTQVRLVSLSNQIPGSFFESSCSLLRHKTSIWPKMKRGENFGIKKTN